MGVVRVQNRKLEYKTPIPKQSQKTVFNVNPFHQKAYYDKSQIKAGYKRSPPLVISSKSINYAFNGDTIGSTPNRKMVF